MNKNRVPKASPEPLPELANFLEPFAPLFRRQTSRDSMERYLTGLLTDLPHKTCDTIADVIAGTSVECLQHLLTDAAWDPLQRRLWRGVYCLRGPSAHRCCLGPIATGRSTCQAAAGAASSGRWHPRVRRHWSAEERNRLGRRGSTIFWYAGQNWQLPGGVNACVICAGIILTPLRHIPFPTHS